MQDDKMSVYRERYKVIVANARDSLHYDVPDSVRDHPYIKEHMDSCFRLLEYWNALIEDGQEGVVENVMRAVIQDGMEANRVAWSMIKKEMNTDKEPLLAMARMCAYNQAILAMADVWYKGGLFHDG